MTAVGSRLYSLWSWYRSLDHLYGLLPDLRSLVNECCIQHASIHMAHVLIIVDRHEIYNQIRWTMFCVLHGYFDTADPGSMVLCPREAGMPMNNSTSFMSVPTFLYIA